MKRSPKSIKKDIYSIVRSRVRKAFKGKKTIQSAILVSKVFEPTKGEALGNDLKTAQVRFKGEFISITKNHPTVKPKDMRGIISQTVKGINAAVRKHYPDIFTRGRSLTELQYKEQVDKIASDLSKLFGSFAGSSGITGKSKVGESNKFNGYV